MILATAAVLFALSEPVVVFSRPESCPDEEKKVDPCTEFADDFARLTSHAAMQRRLASVAFSTRVAQPGEAPFVSVSDPSGREAIRWMGWPSWSSFLDMLERIETASPHLVNAHTDPENADRERALAVLALGDKIRGRALLEAMRQSQSIEKRELATIWLARIDDTHDSFDRYTRDGATERVKFEAWMAIGDGLLDDGRHNEAIEAYDRASEFASQNSAGRFNARTARQRAIAQATPVAGLGLPGAVIAGRRSIQPRERDKRVASVEYRLNGKLVATAKKPPFGASIHFGRIPSRQVLELTSRDSGGKVITKQSLVVNERSEAFAVAIVSPKSHELAGKVDVEVDARVPRGSVVDQLVVEWNGKRVARLTAPPYRTTLDVRPGEAGTLRAVLRLDDGAEVEDVLLANTGAMLFEAGAHLIEVPVYFEGGDTNVAVREDGKPRGVERIIRPDEAPLLIALLIDASDSMGRHMLDVQEAAVRFVEENIESRDRTMVVAFDSQPRVLLRPTSDRARVEKAILSIRARGSTALYDAMITTLFQLHSSGSRKAMVVFSDGLDAASTFSAGDAVEVARRAGVPIYVLALTPGAPPQPLRSGRNAVLVPSVSEKIEQAKRQLLSISRKSGGKGFEMKSLGELPRLWSEIAADLRRQSLLIYRTDTAGAEWRPLEITAKGKPVRAPSGVFVDAE